MIEKPENFSEDVYYCRVASVMYAFNVPYAEVSFEKYAEDGTTLLPNAQFRVEDNDGNVITDENGNAVEFKTTKGTKKFRIRPGTYILRETEPPSGYTVASPVTFTVNTDSTVTYNGRVSENNLVSLQDERSSVTIRKVGADGEKLSDAVIQILDKEGNIVKQWTSREEDEVITGLTVNKEYVLHEEKAPSGYLLAEDVVFALNPDGTLNRTVSEKVKTDENGVILVTNQKPELKIEKVERKYGETSDTKLAGAVIGLYYGQTLISELTSSATDLKTFGTIEAGKKYTIKEESVPAGYTKFDDFTIVVNPDGTAEISEGAPAQYINGVLILKNNYEPTEASVSLRVNKTVTGESPESKDFVFHLKQNNADAKDSITIASVSANETKSGDFTPLTFTEPGTYSYLISEDHTSTTEGYYNGYSFAPDQVVTITVTDDHENGKLLASVSINGIEVKDTDGVYSTGFENIYHATSTSIAIPVVKTFSEDSAPRPSSKDFTFTLKEEGEESAVASVVLSGEGVTVFPTITYDTVGEHVYTITENDPDNRLDYIGYEFDGNEYKVYVTVSDNGGALVSDTVIKKNDEDVCDGVVFTNTYQPEAVAVEIPVTKLLKGDTPKKEVVFTCVLNGKDEAPLPKKQEVRVKAGKTESFDEIVFTKPGTYTYEVTEKNTKEKGYLYDTSVYTVVVEVTDEEGVLKAEWDVENSEENRIVFTNTFHEEPKEVETGVHSHTGMYAGILTAALAAVGIVLLEKKKH